MTVEKMRDETKKLKKELSIMRHRSEETKRIHSEMHHQIDLKRKQKELQDIKTRIEAETIILKDLQLMQGVIK